MNTLRCYVGDITGRAAQHFGAERCWLQDDRIRKYWAENGVTLGDSVVLFDDEIDILYKIIDQDNNELTLYKETEIKRLKPKLNIMVAWGARSKAENEQLVSNLISSGVSHLVPLYTQNSDHPQINKTEFMPTIIRSLENSIFSDLPVIENSMTLQECLSIFSKKYKFTDLTDEFVEDEFYAILVPPLGHWSEPEIRIIKQHGNAYIVETTQISEVYEQLKLLLQ